VRARRRPQATKFNVVIRRKHGLQCAKMCGVANIRLRTQARTQQTFPEHIIIGQAQSKQVTALDDPLQQFEQ